MREATLMPLGLAAALDVEPPPSTRARDRSAQRTLQQDETAVVGNLQVGFELQPVVGTAAIAVQEHQRRRVIAAANNRRQARGLQIQPGDRNADDRQQREE
jgi:hypothetical protein